MDIKFKELQRVEGESQATGKVWVAYKIVGTKINDGTLWKSGNIFDNSYNRDLLDKARELEEGEKVNVKLEQEGKFWNPKDILDYVPQEGGGYAQKAGSGAKGSSQGGSGFKWNGRTGEAYDRSAALYLAFDMMKEGKGDLKKIKPYDLLLASIDLSADIFEYMNKGVTPVVSGKDDALDPPKV